MSDYAYVKQWKARNKDKVAEYARRYRSRHADKVKIVKERYREKSRDERLPREAEMARRRRQADPAGELRRRREFEARKEAERHRIAGRPRASKCELCGCDGRTVFDHCHATGNFRGWLCDRCNRTLGQVKDSIELLRKMISYLECHRGEAEGQATQQAA